MWEKIKPYILIFPAVAVIGTLFIGGLSFGILQSFGLFRIAGKSCFTFDFYYQLFKSEDFLKSIFLTLKTAVISTILSGVFAILIIAALFLIEDNRKSSWIRKIICIPVLFPHIIAAYLVIVMFMKSGWVSSVLYSIGIINNMSQFPAVVNDRNAIGIILTYIWKETPFILLMLLPVVYRIEDSWINIARSLGANKLSFFKEVIFPILIPTIISSMLIVFAFTFSDFEVPYVLGVTYPKFVSVYSYQIYYNGQLDQRPLAFAINFILVIITLILGAAAYKFSRKYDIDRATRW